MCDFITDFITVRDVNYVSFFIFVLTCTIKQGFSTVLGMYGFTLLWKKFLYMLNKFVKMYKQILNTDVLLFLKTKIGN